MSETETIPTTEKKKRGRPRKMQPTGDNFRFEKADPEATMYRLPVPFDPPAENQFFETPKRQQVIDELAPPRDVQAAADEYMDALVAKGEALENMHTTKALVIAKMREHGLTELIVRDGLKKIVLTTEDKVLVKKRKKGGEGD